MVYLLCMDKERDKVQDMDDHSLLQSSAGRKDVDRIENRRPRILLCGGMSFDSNEYFGR